MDAEDVLLKALQLEIDGREFYLQAAQRSTDPQAAQLLGAIFSMFARPGRRGLNRSGSSSRSWPRPRWGTITC